MPFSQRTLQVAACPPNLVRTTTPLVDPRNAQAPLADRAHTYLTVNCAHCHMSDGGGNSSMNLAAALKSPRQTLIDARPEHGGQNLAPRPMETVLAGTGGCTAYDVMLILRRGRHDVRGCSVKLTAERAETDPKVFTRIHIHFVVAGRGLDHLLVTAAYEGMDAAERAADPEHGRTLLVALGYGTALWLMSTSMDMLPIGVVYAIWSGIGMIGAAVGGAWLYGEAINPTMLVGIGVIAVGVTILAAGQGQH